MTCELCKADSGSQRFCCACVAKLSALLTQQPTAKAPVLRTRREELDNKLTHYRVQLKGFCCYVDMRDCPHMDAVPAYALDRRNREPWYPTALTSLHSFVLDSDIPFVTAVTHSQYCDWLQLKEV